jgi:hypothetical protein
MKTTTNYNLSRPWLSVVELRCSVGTCCLRAGLSIPTRLHTDSDSLGEACTPLSPLPDLQASSFARGLLFVSQRLSGPFRPCPSSGLLLSILMEDSDFRSEEAPRLLLSSCSPDVNCLPPPLLLPHWCFDFGLLFLTFRIWSTSSG